ncbi:MAG: YegS/Rv2252/BmrU family lipid kinase [Ruminococcaceae bacterium]|nr:YegS/Rv2252/BmrU family lipid kinase [Oscillospiraceae bacterium]
MIDFFAGICYNVLNCEIIYGDKNKKGGGNMGKMLFIFNPKSGKSKMKNRLFDVIDSFVKEGWDVRVHPTQKANDAYEQIKREGKKYELVVSSGGDGTLKESIGGLMTISEEFRPKFGYIPTGTTNDFACGINIPKSISRAVKKIVGGNPTALDVGKFNGKYFVYVAAFGAFTEVSYETPQSIKNVFGKAAYVLNGIKSLANIKAYNMTVKWEGGEEQGEYILGLITNVNHVAGMTTRYNRDSEINDGLFEVVLVKKPKTIAHLSIIGAEMLSAKLNPENFVHFSAKNILIECDDRVKWTLDGEFGGEFDKGNIEVIKGAINIVI